MKEEYPNNYELIIDSNSGTIKSNIQAQMFLRKDLQSPVGFQKAIEKPLDIFLASLAKTFMEREKDNIQEDK